jgi:predicted ATPase
VIEEPDTAVHPLLLKRLVELFRNYTEGEHPRQFILTTHNPMLLNLFKPEEVRIVERNERGETTVSGVPMDIANIWLETDGAYNLGNLWTTRLLGGVPE